MSYVFFDDEWRFEYYPPKEPTEEKGGILLAFGLLGSLLAFLLIEVALLTP